MPQSSTGDNLVSRGSGSSASALSSLSATGSGDTIQASFDAIMRRMYAIELKLEPLQSLQTGVEALEAAVTGHARHQQELQDVVH
jgi:hypothetical protein